MYRGAHARLSARSHGFPVVLRGGHFVIAGAEQGGGVLRQVPEKKEGFITNEHVS